MDEKKVLEFISFTQADSAQAYQYLSRSNGDVASAVAMFFEGIQGDNVEEFNVLRAPILPSKRRLVNDDSDDEGPISSIQHRGRGMRPDWSHIQSLNVFGDIVNVDKKHSEGRQTLADLFRPPLDIMYKGGFKDAKNAASFMKKYLIVNIQDQSLFDSQKLNRDTWSSHEVKSLIQANFVFAQYHHDSKLASDYVKWYSISKLPHISILDSRTGERMVYWEGFIGPQELEIELQTFLKNNSLNESSNHIEVYELSDCDYDYLDEDAQLAAAIEASMKQVTETDAAACETQTGSSNQMSASVKSECSRTSLTTCNDNGDVRVETDNISVKNENLNNETKNSNQIYEDPDDSFVPSGDPNCTIIIYLPNGTTEKKIFFENSKLSSIAAHVSKTMGALGSEFVLASSFPRRVYFKEEWPKITLKEASLCPRAVIIVELL